MVQMLLIMVVSTILSPSSLALLIGVCACFSVIIGLGIVVALFGVALVIILIIMSIALVKAYRQRERLVKYRELTVKEDL